MITVRTISNSNNPDNPNDTCVISSQEPTSSCITLISDYMTVLSVSESTTELIEGVYGGLNAQLIYGTFTTPPNSISGSAVCAFSMQDIADTFEGAFKEQNAINSNWLPVNSAKVNFITWSFSHSNIPHLFLARSIGRPFLSSRISLFIIIIPNVRCWI